MKFDEDACKAKGIVWTRDGDLMRFMIPGETHVCDVMIGEDGDLDLQPRRAYTHKALMTALGQAT